MQRERRPVVLMEKQLECNGKLGGMESLGMSKVGQAVLARLMESQIWNQLANSVGGGFRKGTIPLFTLVADTSVSLSMPFMPSRCYHGAGAQGE